MSHVRKKKEIQHIRSFDAHKRNDKLNYIADTFKKAVKTLGGLEILVNNVGVINEDDFGKAVDVNVVSKLIDIVGCRTYEILSIIRVDRLSQKSVIAKCRWIGLEILRQFILRIVDVVR